MHICYEDFTSHFLFQHLQAVGWFIQMCLATLFQPVICGVYRPERADLSDVLAYFCVHEDFEYSFPARLLYLTACPTVKKQSQLLQLTEPEMRCLILSLFQLTSTKIQKAQFRGPKGGPIISLNFNEVIMFIIRFLEMNSNNCLRFVEVDPMPVLVALFTSEDTTMKEHAVQLVLSAINHSQNHRSNMVEYLQNFLQIASIDLEITCHGKGTLSCMTFKIADSYIPLTTHHTPNTTHTHAHIIIIQTFIRKNPQCLHHPFIKSIPGVTKG